MNTKGFSQRFLLVTASLAIPYVASSVALLADEHHYHDADHNDDHTWNNQEDRSYRVWVKENHRKYTNFSKLRDEDQRAYWRWRHEHPDDADHRNDVRH